MNAEIVQRHNEVVSSEDDVYVLGDLCLGGAESLASNRQLISSMNGKLHIVVGNHDTPRRIEMYKTLPNIVEIAEVGLKLKHGKYNFICTHYPCLTGNLERESLKQMTCNFYAHTHQTSNFFEDRPYCYHVGVDSHSCYPVNIETAIEEMNDKVRECVNYLDNEIN